MSDLLQQLAFISELEKLKVVYRQNGVIDKSRAENSAEHSWHLAIMAILLREHNVAGEIDILRVIKMLLIHDIVEIDTGDTYLYDEQKRTKVVDNEHEAALRIFSLLPDRQRDEFFILWQEFEAREIPESKFAASIDNLHPLLNHLITAQEQHNPHGMTKTGVINKKIFIKDISPVLWELAQDIIDKSVGKGLYHDV